MGSVTRNKSRETDRDLAVPRAGATGLEPATSGVTGAQRGVHFA
jgi:hypothetical protein